MGLPTTLAPTTYHIARTGLMASVYIRSTLVYLLFKYCACYTLQVYQPLCGLSIYFASHSC